MIFEMDNKLESETIEKIRNLPESERANLDIDEWLKEAEASIKEMKINSDREVAME